jgi:hypothetical protein
MPSPSPSKRAQGKGSIILNGASCSTSARGAIKGSALPEWDDGRQDTKGVSGYMGSGFSLSLASLNPPSLRDDSEDGPTRRSEDEADCGGKVNATASDGCAKIERGWSARSEPGLS